MGVILLNVLLKETPFVRFGMSHIVSIVFLCAITLILIFLRRRATTAEQKQKINYIWGCFLFLGATFFQVYKFANASFYKGWLLPLQLCDVAMYAAIGAMWLGSRIAKSILFYWGLTLSTQGVVTPDTWFDFPHVDFFRYWFLHLGVVVTALYVVIGMRFRPTWADYRHIVLLTLAWCGLVYVYNVLFGGNYIYLISKPETSSALDYFPDWPLYVFMTLGLSFAIWFFLTIPFANCNRQKGIQ